MILIFSKAKLELSTEIVIDWLIYYEADYRRINGIEILRDFTYELDGFKIKDAFREVRACWFRRLFEPETNAEYLKDIDLSYDNLITISKYLTDERIGFARLIWNALADKFWLTNPLTMNISKVEMLQTAKMFGLSVPETIITTKKTDLIAFKHRFGRIITKPIIDCIAMDTEEAMLTLKTVEVSDDVIASISDQFYPSKFQELIEKEFEIRAFFLGGNFYSMAMFSQNRDATRIDFRNYDAVNPVRTVPISLRKETEGKLAELMRHFDLRTGSIDLIRTVDGRDVFLEVNQGGQFGMTSGPCNYYLHREIGKFLIKNDC